MLKLKDTLPTIKGLTDAGWNVMFPPKTNAVVQVMWDDGSSDNRSLAVYDSIAKLPPEPMVRYWWSFPDLARLNDKAIIAWREVKNPADDLTGRIYRWNADAFGGVHNKEFAS